MSVTERQHRDRVRDRFTNTAESFAQFVLTERADETSGLASMLVADLPNYQRASALDIGCGPGTFSLPLAAEIGHVVGADITPAMLFMARQSADAASVKNVRFICADGYELPFADASFGIAICCYTLHHLMEPQRVIREMSRVMRPGGRVGIVDLVIGEGADGELENRIESLRDPSHVSTLTATRIQTFLADAGLVLGETAQHKRERQFEGWMRMAGQKPGSSAYAEARRLMESSIGNQGTAFGAHIKPETGELLFSQITSALVAEKSGGSSS
jgi:ubiquinone/menaquinone biosynthesis C-methylase UbiE